MTTQRQGVATSTCAKDILEKKWNKLCEMKEIRKVVVGSDFFFQNNNKGDTDDTQVSLGTTLLLICLGVLLKNDRLNFSILLCYLLWNHSNNTENTWLWH